jgi:hypothetical protein
MTIVTIEAAVFVCLAQLMAAGARTGDSGGRAYKTRRNSSRDDPPRIYGLLRLGPMNPSREQRLAARNVFKLSAALAGRNSCSLADMLRKRPDSAKSPRLALSQRSRALPTKKSHLAVVVWQRLLR